MISNHFAHVDNPLFCLTQSYLVRQTKTPIQLPLYYTHSITSLTLFLVLKPTRTPFYLYLPLSPSLPLFLSFFKGPTTPFPFTFIGTLLSHLYVFLFIPLHVHNYMLLFISFNPRQYNDIYLFPSQVHFYHSQVPFSISLFHLHISIPLSLPLSFSDRQYNNITLFQILLTSQVHFYLCLSYNHSDMSFPFTHLYLFPPSHYHTQTHFLIACNVSF